MKAGWIGFLEREETFWDDCRQLARLGYRGMEGGDPLLVGDAPANLQRFHDMGLSVLTVAADLRALHEGDIASCIERAHALQSPRATVYASAVNASFWGETPTRDACLRDIDCLETSAVALAREGIELCYHNHHQDLTVRFGGIPFLDLLLQNAPSVRLELDVAWVHNAGRDPCDILRHVAPRLSMIHVKDYLPGAPRADGSGFEPTFVSVGNGALDLRATLAEAASLGVPWAVVEQDAMHHLTPMESLTCAYLNIKETGLLEG